MAKFFGYFPKIYYDIAQKQETNYQLVTNVFFRFRIIRDVLKNISAYYLHTIKDHDKPEILAERIYGDAEAHWIILFANDIVDPHYGWPLTTSQFRKYIIKKYGSIEWAQTHYHHYEKVIQRTESASGQMTETRFWIDENKLTTNNMEVPYDYYQSLPVTQETDTFDFGNDKSVLQTVFSDRITYFDYENQINESKRLIKIVKPEYYREIMREFKQLTNTTEQKYIRRLS